MVNQDLISLIPHDLAWEYKVLPVKKEGETLFLTCPETCDPVLQDELAIILGYPVQVLPKPEAWIREQLTRHYRQGRGKKALEGRDPGLLMEVLEDAHSLGASDIHFEVLKEKARIRVRVDGRLLERYSVKREDYPALVNRVKIKAGLDITEKRIPQDGRILEENLGLDIRVSSLPNLYGEKLVLRLLSMERVNLDWQKLGMGVAIRAHFEKAIRHPSGLILISGPTGSGKTTTLYAALKRLHRPEYNLMTVEDPVEYRLEGITQVQVQDKVGLGFSTVLRSLLRQDPDILMIGEIRDLETATIAVRASLTGHLVFSTIHTNSAWGVVERLADMGVPRYLLASSLRLVAAQRLVRVLCPSCKAQKKTWMEPVGCTSCHFTGFSGRKALYEVVPIESQSKKWIREGEEPEKEGLKKIGACLMEDQAMDLLNSGETSFGEVEYLINQNPGS